ncbi:hypothetical protein [Gorillibacterium sp. sgz5001074]|uniref:hypothetical protein n=1 Tax=Gorillibacterium sp. sgz5001074 TaxID=3446695 RepID=UPI003F664369
MSLFTVRLRVGIALFLLIPAAITGCALDKPVAGDKLYIAEGYKDSLTAMELTEISGFPYFTPPYISIAEDKNHSQYAVLFYRTGEIRKVPLPRTLEQILQVLSQEGISLQLQSNEFHNLHLLEIRERLTWSYDDGTHKLYLDPEGNPIDPFAAPPSSP